MKQKLTRSLINLRTTFTSFTLGQQVVAVIGGAAILLAAFLVFRWVSTPDYAPLYSNLAASDASAIVDELDSQGTPYKLANGGSTVMVPRDSVYATRISLSGQGLPEQSSGQGYSLLDNQDISTSEFQEQTDFKRAMEGELASTIEAVDGVTTAVVHLALPPAKVFADQQDPPTASVLIDTAAGSTFDAEQVQAIVHLVASSIDGLDPDNVTVADSSGKVLSSSDAGALGASTRDQQVTSFQQQTSQRIQSMLDRVLGPGNSTVQVTADLDFDKSVSESTTYGKNTRVPPLSSSSSSEKYNGPAGGGSSSTGVVGPDGQMDSFGGTGAGGKSSYVKESTTADNAIPTTVEHREKAPGSINSLHVGVVLDSAAAQTVNATDVQDLIAATVGINPSRGDTVQVSTMPFDRTADKAAAAELAAAAKAAKTQRMWDLARNAGIAVAILAVLLIAWLRSRKRSRRREQTTTYLVEQLRNDAAERQAAAVAIQHSPALEALENADRASDDLRRELADLADGQPEDVAALLRGWLVERP
jgi:flagellar M-ring protein FliF